MQFFELENSYTLESGAVVHKPTVAFDTYGTLNADKSNVVWVCHALSANSDVYDWWPGLFGENDFYNPKEHFIVCANFIGSHYGSTGPLSENPETGKPYFHDFPEVTIRDMVGLHILLAKHLGVEDISMIIGGSMGGHQCLEWSVMEPERIKGMCLLATSAVISPWANALNHTQRMAIESDATWKENNLEAGDAGMRAARAIALLSYRNQGAYNKTQKENLDEQIYPERAGSYQDYQGSKLSKRFNAFSYWHISKAMDSHNVGRGRGGVEASLAKIKARTLVLGIDSDLLFPVDEQAFLAKHIPDARLEVLSSDYGHDGFLIETEKISKALKHFTEEVTV